MRSGRDAGSGPARWRVAVGLLAVLLLGSTGCGTPVNPGPAPTTEPTPTPGVPPTRGSSPTRAPSSTTAPATAAATPTQRAPSPATPPLPTASATAPPTASATPLPTRPQTTTPPTTAPAAPTATATPLPVPVIHAFTAGTDIADPGDTLVLSWESSGATEAQLYKLFYSGQLPPDGWDVPVTGSYTFTLSPDEVNWVSFFLYVRDDAQRHASATTTVVLRCRYTWAFQPAPEELCPTERLVSAAAEQAFERGTMLWVEAEDAIYVLYAGQEASPKWERFTDEWDPGEPEQDPALEPPPGRQQPQRGFGLVWREQPGVRLRLGWAIEQEQGFTTTMQRTTRYKYNAWYLLARDGCVWYLGPERSSWRKIAPAD
jgi:hypothetical protein